MDGLLLGGQASVAWAGEAWIASYAGGLVSGLKVNGASTKRAVPKAGDLVRVGKSEYRLVVG